MSQTVDIGAARVRLIVDAEDFDAIIAQGKNAVRGFGTEAQTAYDRTEKATRRAADALLDYVNSLGRADTTLDRYVRNASRMGVEKPVLDAAILAWQKHNDQVEEAQRAQDEQTAAVKRAQAAYKELTSVQQEQERQQRAIADAAARARVEEGSAQFARNAQERFNNQLGVVDTDPRAASSRRADAEAAFLPLIQAENDALEKQKLLADTIAAARAQQTAALAQQDYNKLLGIDAQEDALALQRRRADAQAAFLPLIEKEAKAERDTLQRQQNADNYIKQLQNIESAAGKTYYELLRLKAAELGVADAAEPFIARIQKANADMGRGTISAKQYALAVQQLPAQFTDVFTSLAGGQNPLLVLLQQGGQVKDMFGGVKTAIGAVAKEATKLATNPYILLAAAVAAVAVAAFQADTRLTALAVSAAKGNGVAGSARDLSRYAEQLNTLNNINLSSADAALSKLAESGKLAGENFRLAAEASARWANVTGEAVDDVADKFTSIARDPMAAVLDGTVKITSAQYDQIKALVENGEQQKAVTELVKIYYDQVNNNSQSVITNLSNTAKAWRDIKDQVTSAYRQTQNFFDFLVGAAQKASDRFDKLPLLTKLAPGSGILAALRGLADAEPAEATAAGAAATAPVAAMDAAKRAITLTQNQIRANEDLDKAWGNSGSKAELLAAKVKKLNATLRNATDSALAQRDIVRGPDGTFSGKGYDRLVKALDSGGPRARRERQGPDPTKAIQERERTALNELRKVQQEFDFVYADRESTIEAYYARSLFLARQEADVQIKSNNEQIKALTGRPDSEDKIAALRQQNSTVEEQFAAKKAKLDREEVLATRQRTAALRDYIQALADGNAQLERGFSQSARAVGRGGRNPERLNALDNAQADAARNVRQIEDQLADKRISPEEAAAKKQAQFDALAEKQRVIQQGYADIRAAESDYLNGSTKAWEDWLEQVGNIAQQVGAITTSAIGGMVDVISNKIRTGTSGFKDYLDNLNKQILDFVLKQQLTKFFKDIGRATEGTDFGSAVVSLGSALFGKSEKGNVFGGGALASYRNSIVSQPTFFPFARGGVPNVGLMGERSGKPHEAVMPLTRMPGGNLGVEVKGGGQKITNVSQVFNVPGVVDRTTRDQLAIKMLGGAQRAARRN
jgi:lambda family phage tail tape measure protein